MKIEKVTYQNLPNTVKIYNIYNHYQSLKTKKKLAFTDGNLLKIHPGICMNMCVGVCEKNM